jgi:hypothetical protein
MKTLFFISSSVFLLVCLLSIARASTNDSDVEGTKNATRGGKSKENNTFLC